MEPILRPRACITNPSSILNPGQHFLGANSGLVVERVVVGPSALSQGRIRGVKRVEGHEDVTKLGSGDVLEDVHVVG